MLLPYTKLHPPLPHDQSCLRARLLPSSLPALTVIHAPTGYGKTTLALQLLAQHQATGSWMSVDEFDNDPLRFWSGVVSALGQALKGLSRQSLQLLQGPQQGLPDLVVSLLNELHTLTHQERDQVVILVLDDFHLLTNPPLIQSVNLFLDHLPAAFRIVLTSRSIPGLKLAQRKSKGQAIEIGASELKFTETEAAHFFEHHQPTWPPGMLRAVTDRCEGWAAALRLYSVSRPGCASNTLQIAPDQDVYEVLLTDVIAHLPHNLQTFVEQTAFLPRFCAALADHVLNTQNAAAVIRELVRLNLFVVPLDHEQVWFRYHDLFRALVGSRTTATAAAQARHRQQAAAWFEANDQAMEAMGQYLLAKQWGDAGRLLARVGPTWARQGQSETVRRMLAALPDQVWQAHAELLCLRVWIASDAEKFAEGREWLERAMQLIDSHAVRIDNRAALRCEVLTLQAIVARLHGQWDETITLSRTALQTAAAARLPLRWRSYLTLGAHAYAQGELMPAQTHLQDAVSWALEEEHLYGVAQSCGYLSEVLYQQGELQRALRMAHGVKDALEASPFGTGRLAAWRLIGLVDLLREQDELQQAEQALAALRELRSLETCESLQHLIILLRTFTLAMSRRDADLAERTTHEIEAVQTRMRFQTVYASGSVGALRAEVAWLRGDQLSAAHWLERHLGQQDVNEQQRPSPFLRERDDLVAIRILVMLQRHDQALQHAQALYQRAAPAGRVLTQAICLMWQAAAAMELGNKAHAQQHMLDALRLTAGAGFRRVFLDQGVGIEPALSACSEHHRYGALASALSAQILAEGQAAIHPEASLAPSQSPAPAALSPRELELLRYVREGFSDKEIARLAHISPGTVKTHLRNIYRKLEANGRVQALAKLNLLAA